MEKLRTVFMSKSINLFSSYLPRNNRFIIHGKFFENVNIFPNFATFAIGQFKTSGSEGNKKKTKSPIVCSLFV